VDWILNKSCPLGHRKGLLTFGKAKVYPGKLEQQPNFNVRKSSEGLKRILQHFFRQPITFRNLNVFSYGKERLRGAGCTRAA
jgi:hypothetical protein